MCKLPQNKIPAFWAYPNNSSQVARSLLVRFDRKGGGMATQDLGMGQEWGGPTQFVSFSVIKPSVKPSTIEHIWNPWYISSSIKIVPLMKYQWI